MWQKQLLDNIRDLNPIVVRQVDGYISILELSFDDCYYNNVLIVSRLNPYATFFDVTLRHMIKGEIVKSKKYKNILDLRLLLLKEMQKTPL